MKQLNNLSTGEVIEIYKVKESGIYYTIYENTLFKELDIFGISKRVDLYSKTFKTSLNSPTVEEAEEEATISKILETETSFVDNGDIQNWNILIGSTGQQTVIRIIITNEAYDNALVDRDKVGGEYYLLNQVINYANTLPSNTSNVRTYGLAQYVEDLLPEHRFVLESYIGKGVTIENKL